MISKNSFSCASFFLSEASAKVQLSHQSHKYFNKKKQRKYTFYRNLDINQNNPLDNLKNIITFAVQSSLSEKKERNNGKR